MCVCERERECVESKKSRKKNNNYICFGVSLSNPTDPLAEVGVAVFGLNIGDGAGGEGKTGILSAVESPVVFFT